MYVAVRHFSLCRLILIGLLLSQCPLLAADSVESSGSIVRTLIPAVAFGTTFYLHDREGRVQFYKSFFTNYATTYALKEISKKNRPDDSGDDSFPSGHTSVAFQGAAFIHRRYGLKYAIPAYLAAGYVGWTRVESDQHYVEDVVAGAALGIASSFIFTHPYHDLVATPLVGDGFYGLVISRQW